MWHLRLAVASALLLAAGIAAVAVSPTPTAAGPPADAPAAALATELARVAPEYGRLMLVLDSSGSMSEPAEGRHTKIRAAKTALGTVVDELPDEAQVGLRVFGSEVFSRSDPGACEDSELVVEPGTDNRDDLRAAIDDYKPYGETPIPFALQEAANDLGDEGARSIVLVSDGESTCGDPCAVARQVSGEGIDLHIDVVGLSVSSAARRQLECIAREGHGSYYDADSAEDIEVHVTRVAERALRPFALTGTPIRGGPVDAPTPITVGDWTDRLGARGASTSYVFDRTAAGTTLRVAAITQSEKGTSQYLEVEIVDPEGNRCDHNQVGRPLDTRSIIGAGATAGPETECDQPGQYRITVTRGRASTETAPIGLSVTEEPAVEDPGYDATGEVQVAEPRVAGEATDVVGGSSFTNAPELGSGRWSSALVPGEASLFAVPLEFGQSTRISVEFSELSPELEAVVGFFPPLCDITLYSPMRAQLPEPDGSTVTANVVGETMMTATAPVSRAHAEPRGDFDGGGDYTAAGSYYLGVALAREDYSVEFPFTINVEVVGKPADAPTYAEGVTWTVEDGVSGEDEETTDGPTGATGSGDGSGSGRTVALVAAVGGLAALFGGLFVWRRRPAGPSSGAAGDQGF